MCSVTPLPHLNAVLLLSWSGNIGQRDKVCTSVGSATPPYSGLFSAVLTVYGSFCPALPPFFLWPPNNIMPISAECSQWTTAPMFQYSFKYSCWNKYWNFRGFLWCVGVGLFGETGFQELLGASSQQQQQSLTFRQIRIYFFQGTAG